MKLVGFSVRYFTCFILIQTLRVDGGVVRVKGTFGVWISVLLLGSILLTPDIPVQYVVCFRSKGTPSHPGKGEQQIFLFRLPISY